MIKFALSKDMKKIDSKKLVVVLGMHRSGTSAITRGLEVLGVELGDHLLPAREDNNPKGFLEDVDINALNIEMLHSFGDDWDRLTPTQTLSVDQLQERGFVLRAVELLRSKFKRSHVFGFKDPRVAKLLPFWKAVFEQMRLDVAYVVPLRNPLSVVRSLEKRDALDAVKTYLLWAQHVVSSLVETAQCKRIVVDFDRILSDPGSELERIAVHLGLKLDKEKLQVYHEAFLDKGLQHTAYERSDLLLDVACPPLVVELFDAMLAGAGDTVDFESDAFRTKLREWQSELQRLRAPMALIDKMSAERAVKRQFVDTLGREVAGLQAHVLHLSETIESLILDRDAQRAGFEQSNTALAQLANEREAQVAHLDQTIASLVLDRDAQRAGFEQSNTALAQLANEREAQVALLDQTITSLVLDRDAQKAELAKLAQDRDAEVVGLNQTLATLVLDRDAQKAGLLQVITDQNHTIAGLNNESDRLRGELSVVHKSKSWRFTAPIRQFLNWIRKANPEPGKNLREGSDPQLKAVPSQVLLQNDPLSTPLDIETTASAKKTAQRILLVSYYCPTRAHAGGLRILDIYMMVRSKCPDARIDLLTHHRPDVDWSMDGLDNIFDNVYLSQTEDLSVDVLARMQGNQVEKYDLVDLQFHQSAYHLQDFRAISSKVIFTPMESQAKVLFMDFSAKLKAGKPIGFKRVASLIKLAAEEIGFCRNADEVICVSQTDASFLRAVTGSSKIKSIETGISQLEFSQALEPDFRPEPAEKKALKIIYIAYFGSETNVVALRWFLENVHPIIKGLVPSYVLSVVGRGDLSGFEKFRDNSLELVGEVPTISPHISGARVGIAPALGGSGLRGKINQYSVLGVPCVASPIALKGLAYQDGKDVFVAENPKDFADRCVSLLTDVEMNDRIATAARQLCLDRYSWQSKWPQIQAAYGIKSTA